MQTHIEIKKLFKNVSYELFLGQAWLPRKFWNILVLLSRSSHPWLLASPVLGGPEPKICWQTADSMRTNLPHWGAWGRCARNSKVLLRDSEILLRNGRRSMKKPGWSSLPSRQPPQKRQLAIIETQCSWLENVIHFGKQCRTTKNDKLPISEKRTPQQEKNKDGQHAKAPDHKKNEPKEATQFESRGAN